MALSKQHHKEDDAAQEAAGDWQRVVEFLSRGASYVERPRQVERIDTHISAVFLTDRFAYKLKKRVAFDFLDFRSPASRLAACREEVRLNRRLAPDVYLGVEGLCRDAAGNYRWASARETASEWVVKMRRLPLASRLDQLLLAGQLRETDLRSLIDMLLRFYQQLPPLPVSADTYLEQLARHVDGNDRELSVDGSPLPVDVVRRVHTAQRRLLRLWPELWASRVCDGRIVEGHGDLRPEHVYLLPQPVVIDAIEFNAEFRRLDVLDEMSFLAVECEMLGDTQLGSRLIERYCRMTLDWPTVRVIEFYRSYRACVRAKVVLLRSRQTSGDASREAVELARRYLAKAEQTLGEFARPWLVVVRGRSGTGKSQIAAQVANRLAAELLQTDVMRAELSGGSVAEGPGPPGEFGAGRYAPERRRAVYEALRSRAAQYLAAGRSVVLDGTYLAADARRAAAQLAQEHSARFLEVTCQCRAETARRRICERLERGGDASEFHPEWLDAQAREEEPCTPAWAVCSLNTEALPAELEQQICLALRALDRPARSGGAAREETRPPIEQLAVLDRTTSGKGR